MDPHVLFQHNLFCVVIKAGLQYYDDFNYE